MTVEVRSLTRRVRLDTPPPDGVATQILSVEPGSTDAQVLEWARQTLEPAAVAELEARVALEADGGESM